MKMPLKSRLFVLLLLLCFCRMVFAAGERLSLWEASGASGTVYLFGSIHVCTAECFPLSGSVLKRFDASDALMIELDPQKAGAQTSLLNAATLPVGERLDKKLTVAEWSALSVVLNGLGLAPERLNTLRPWMISLLISMQVAKQAGFELEKGVDLSLLARSRAQGKTLIELETAERQIRALSAGSEQEQTESLNRMVVQVRSGRMPAMLGDLFVAWKTGNAEALGKLVLEDMPEDSIQTRELLNQRNHEMAHAIVLRQRDGGKLFVVVGAAHMIGDEGLPALLQKQGFRVTQIHDGE